MRYFIAILFFSFLSLAFSCGHKNTTTTVTPDNVKDPLILANQKYVLQESDEIDEYIRQRKLDMKKTGTGLRYMIYHQGTGVKAEKGMYARVAYKISLLNGTECYSSAENGPKGFLIGQDNVESGLHEAMEYMKVGDRAIFILPSHLAHGLMGDENKIPPRSSVVYDIELLSLTK